MQVLNPRNFRHHAHSTLSLKLSFSNMKQYTPDLEPRKSIMHYFFMATPKRIVISREDVVKRCRKRNFDPVDFLIDIAKLGNVGSGKEAQEAKVQDRIKAAVQLAGMIVPQQKAVEVQSNERKELTIKVQSFEILEPKRQKQVTDSGEVIDIKVDRFDESASDVASARREENANQC